MGGTPSSDYSLQPAAEVKPAIVAVVLIVIGNLEYALAGSDVQKLNLVDIAVRVFNAGRGFNFSAKQLSAHKLLEIVRRDHVAVLTTVLRIVK